MRRKKDSDRTRGRTDEDTGRCGVGKSEGLKGRREEEMNMVSTDVMNTRPRQRHGEIL